MRFLQGLLLLVGSAALGAMTFGLGLATLLAATAFRPRPGQEPGAAWGDVVAFLAVATCGGTLGAAAGFLLAAARLARATSLRWPSLVWLGVAVGLAAAGGYLLAGTPGRYVPRDVLRWWPASVCFVAATGTLGGLVGAALGPTRRAGE